MDLFIKILNEIYSATFGVRAAFEASRNKVRIKLEELYSYLETIPLQPTHEKRHLYEYYLRSVCAYYARSMDYLPSIAHLASRRLLLSVEEKYKQGKQLTNAEIYMTRVHLVPRVAKEKKDFFGYDYADIKRFSKESPEYLICKVLLSRVNKEGRTIEPSIVTISMLDKVAFYLLGNNFLEELKGNTELTTSYTEITDIFNLKAELEDRLKLIEASNIFSALGYRLTAKLGKTILNYCELLLWKKCFDKKDERIKEFISSRIKWPVKDWDRFQTKIEFKLKEMRSSIPPYEFDTVNRVMLQTWMVEAVNKYKEFLNK
mgnify:CR=1 FL=1